MLKTRPPVSLPNLDRHTIRLRRLVDVTPSAIHLSPVFTGANVARANNRLLRLQPPVSVPHRPVQPCGKLSHARPRFYGADATRFEQRNRRYVDRVQKFVRKVGPTVFSGASAQAYRRRMLRLAEKG